MADIPLSSIAGGWWGFNPQATGNYSTSNGGLYGQRITSLDISAKSEVLNLTGRWAVFHLHSDSSGTGGNTLISLTVDGRTVCNDLDVGLTSPEVEIYSTGGTGSLGTSSGLMPPMIVNSSLSLSLQKTGATAITLNVLAIPLG